MRSMRWYSCCSSAYRSARLARWLTALLRLSDSSLTTRRRLSHSPAWGGAGEGGGARQQGGITAAAGMHGSRSSTAPQLHLPPQPLPRPRTRRWYASTAARRSASLAASAPCSCSISASMSATLPWSALLAGGPWLGAARGRGTRSSRCTHASSASSLLLSACRMAASLLLLLLLPWPPSPPLVYR